MSKRDVYNRLRITAPVRNQIKGFTAQSVKSVYGGELRKQVASVGGPRGALTISDPRSLASIDRQASVTATSIQRTYNRMLQNAIDRLPNGTSAELMTGLKPFIDKTRGYNMDTLVPLASDLARQTARNDFVANNDLPGHWEFYGAAECPRCQQAREDTSIMVPNHPHCFVAGTVVYGPSAQLAFARPYEGPIVTIRTASGDELTGTPNHPVLTVEGWVALGLLAEGGNILRCRDGERMAEALHGPDKDQVPSLIEQVGRARAMSLFKVPSAAADFHGDGMTDSDIDVILADRLLQDDGLSGDGGQYLGEPSLGRTRVNRGPLFAESASGQLALGLLSASYSRMGSVGSSRPFFGREETARKAVCLSHAANRGAGGDEATSYDGAINAAVQGQALLGLPSEVASSHQIGVREGGRGVAEATDLGKRSESDTGVSQPLDHSRGSGMDLAGELRVRFPGLVTSDQIVEVRRGWSVCHVYNLSTTEGWYAANNVIVSNCECGRTFVVSGAIAPGQALWAGAEEPITADAELAMVGVERRKTSTLPAILKDWSEASHPRGWHGRFAPSGSSGSSGEHESGGAGGGRIEMAAAKLTLNDARRVRNSYHSGDSIATVARLHGLSTTAVRNIIAHKTHRETFVKGEKTTIYHARQIRADHAAGKSVKDLATETGLSDRFIRKVIAHQAHREPKGGGGEAPKPGPKDVPRRRPATPEVTHPMTPEPRPHPEQERIAPEAVTHLSQLQGKLHLYTRDEKQQVIENAIWRFSDEVKAPSKPGEHTHWPHAEAGRSNSEAGRRMNRGMEDVGRGRGIRVNDVVERGKNRLGYVNPDRPHIVNLKSGLKPDVRGMVMAHEMGHLKEPQDMATKLYFQSKNARGQSEARVEAQAALIGEFYGLSGVVRAQSRDYVRGWVGRHHTFSAIDRPFIIDQVLAAMQASAF